jgi:hypothetical protein
LFSGKIKQNAIWAVTIASVLVALVLKFAIPAQGSHPFLLWYHANVQLIEVALGILVPVVILSIYEWRSATVSEGYLLLKSLHKKEIPFTEVSSSLFPARILAISILVLALIIFLLAVSAENAKLLMMLFSGLLAFIGLGIFWAIKIAGTKPLNGRVQTGKKIYKNKIVRINE